MKTELRQALAKALVFGAAFGCAAGLTVASVGVWLGHPLECPKARWDRNAIRCVETFASFSGNESYVVTAILENTTGRDYRLPERLAVYQRGKPVRNLRPFEAFVFTGRIPIPAHERAQLEFGFVFTCDERVLDTERPRRCFEKATRQVDSLMWVDEDAGIRVELPRPTWGRPTQR